MFKESYFVRSFRVHVSYTRPPNTRPNSDITWLFNIRLIASQIGLDRSRVRPYPLRTAFRSEKQSLRDAHW
jgi:hypothetical protein